MQKLADEFKILFEEDLDLNGELIDLKPEISGPLIWSNLYLALLLYPKNPSPEDQAKMTNLIRFYETSIGCMKCESEFAVFMNRFPPEQWTSEKHKVAAYFLTLQNEIRSRNNQALYTVRQVQQFLNKFVYASKTKIEFDSLPLDNLLFSTFEKPSSPLLPPPPAPFSPPPSSSPPRSSLSPLLRRNPFSLFEVYSAILFILLFLVLFCVLLGFQYGSVECVIRFLHFILSK